MVIFGDPVSGTQYFGYSIALGGLTYYKLGGDKFKSGLNDARLSLATYRQNYPARSRGIVLAIVLFFVCLVLYSSWPAIPDQYKKPITG